MKIFVLLARVPFPLEKGDKLRAFHQIKSLSEKHEIVLFALNDIDLHKDAIKELGLFCKKIHIFKLSKFSIFINIVKAFFSGKPLQVGYFYNSKALKLIHEIIADEKPDHIYCQLIRVTEYVRNIKIPKSLDYQDALSKGYERRMMQASFFEKIIFKLESVRMKKYERDIFNIFNNKVIISEQDRALINHPDNMQIKIVRNGVDMQFFKAYDSFKTTDLVFAGNMNYPPNVDSAEFLVKKVLPLLFDQYPDIKLKIAGTSPTQQVLDLRSKHVEVTGWVDDMRKCYADSRIFIAPMQLGCGLQNKLLEAMSMCIPCITSELANNSLQAKENVEILIGKIPMDYAKHIIYLLQNPEQASILAENAYEFVKRNYSWEKHNTILDQIICSTNK